MFHKIKNFITLSGEPHTVEYLVYEKHFGQIINHSLNILFTVLSIQFIKGVPFYVHKIHVTTLTSLLLISKYLWKYPMLHNFLFATIISVYGPLVITIDRSTIFYAVAGLIGNLNCKQVATGSFI